jgi:hypothetical protein
MDDIELSGYVKRRNSTERNAAQSKIWQIRPPTPTIGTVLYPSDFDVQIEKL